MAYLSSQELNAWRKAIVHQYVVETKFCEPEKKGILAQNGLCLSEAEPQMILGGKFERFHLVPQAKKAGKKGL